MHVYEKKLNAGVITDTLGKGSATLDSEGTYVACHIEVIVPFAINICMYIKQNLKI